MKLILFALFAIEATHMEAAQMHEEATRLPEKAALPSGASSDMEFGQVYRSGPISALIVRSADQLAVIVRTTSCDTEAITVLVRVNDNWSADGHPFYSMPKASIRPRCNDRVPAMLVFDIGQRRVLNVTITETAATHRVGTPAIDAFARQ